MSEQLEKLKTELAATEAQEREAKHIVVKFSTARWKIQMEIAALEWNAKPGQRVVGTNYDGTHEGKQVYMISKVTSFSLQSRPTVYGFKVKKDGTPAKVENYIGCYWKCVE